MQRALLKVTAALLIGAGIAYMHPLSAADAGATDAPKPADAAPAAPAAAAPAAAQPANRFLISRQRRALRKAQPTSRRTR